MLYVNARMLKKLAHEVILLTFSRMKPVYFVFIKFNSHLLQIRKVGGWKLSAKIVGGFAKNSSRTNLLK